MKNFRFTFLTILLSVLFVSSVSAENFFICLGSYRNKANAQDLVYKMRQDFIPSSIYEMQDSKGSLFRVFVEIPYKTREEANEAVETLKSIESFSKYNIKDPWIFKADIKADKHNTLPTAIKQDKKIEPEKKVQKTEPKLEEKQVSKQEPVQETKQQSKLEIEPQVEQNEIEQNEEKQEEPKIEKQEEQIQNSVTSEENNSVQEIPFVPQIPENAMELFVEIETEGEIEEQETSEDFSFPNNSNTTKTYLTMNDMEKIPLSQEKPYSVFVRDYKVEQNALNDMARLAELGIESYLIKTFDEEKYFSFEIHVGAFSSIEEANIIQKNLAKVSIDYTDVSDYQNIKKKIESYDNLIAVENISYENINGDLSSLYSDKVLYCIKNFPVQKDTIIDQVGVFDFENIEDSFERTKNLRSLFATVENIDFTSATIESCAFSVYTDELFSKNTSVSLFYGSDFNFKETAQSKIREFHDKGNILNCVLDSDDNTTYLFCINQSKNIFIFIETTDYSQEELFNLFNNQANEDGLLSYPEFKNTILILPQNDNEYQKFAEYNSSEKNKAENIKFSSFTLENVSYEYSKERDYSEWSVPLVGQWFAEGRFSINDEMVSIGYFFLNYDYSAKLSHNLFMKAKMQDKDKDRISHFSKVNGGNSWYLDNEFMKELSFTQKAYVIAVDSYSDSAFEENDMIEIAKKLKIW